MPSLDRLSLSTQPLDTFITNQPFEPFTKPFIWNQPHTHLAEPLENLTLSPFYP